MVIFGVYFEEESKELDDGLDVGMSKREDSRMNCGVLVSNWVDAGLRKREGSYIVPTIWW